MCLGHNFLKKMATGPYGNWLSLDSLALSLKLRSFLAPSCWKFLGVYIVLSRSPLNAVALVYLGQC